ncbi:MAG: ATP-binding protein [Burkholderiales bacterium]|nr:ATP-binding protein [Burkholderiales bacterium]
MSDLHWGFNPDTLIEHALELIADGDEARWQKHCQAAISSAIAPPLFNRLDLNPLEIAALALVLTIDASTSPARRLCESGEPSLQLLAQLLSPCASNYPETLATLAAGPLLTRRLLLNGKGKEIASMHPSPQLRLALLSQEKVTSHDINRLLMKLTPPAHPLVSRSALPAAQGFQLTGEEGSGRRSALLAVAGETPVYLINSSRFYQFDNTEELLADLLSFIDLNHGWLLWPDEDKLIAQTTLLPQIEQWLAGHPQRRIIRLAKDATQAPACLAANLTLSTPDEKEALALWRALLPASWQDLPGLPALAARYPLIPGELRRIIAPLDDAQQPDIKDLEDACQRHQPSTLGKLARRITPRAGLEDMTLAAEERESLSELMLRYQHRHQLHASSLSAGTGLTALFWGRPGTGKTLAAHALAKEMGLPLYQVNLAQVSSKWIGETEKHLATLFDDAERQPCVLFFDEADAVFGRRSEVKDSHDRNANLSVSYLLQRLDEGSALAILASNFKQNLDPAFLRRFAFTIEFSLPDEARRQSLWQSHATHLALPAPLIASLARDFELSPSQISNIVLSITLAQLARPESHITDQIAHALRREYDKTDQRYPMSPRISAWQMNNSAVAL